MTAPELEIYIHIPFCVRKCAYCDFLSMPASASLQEAYFGALLREIRSAKAPDLPVRSIFVGGGTPSLPEPELIARTLGAVRERFRVREDAEITLECNPGTLSPRALKIYRESGANRISLGLQSADNGELARLGRIHTFEQFLESFAYCREAGFSNLNVDLMSSLPGQDAASWERTLRSVLKLSPEHISAYSLIIEEGTPFYERYGEADALRRLDRPQMLLPSEEEEREMVHMTGRILEEYGLYPYEISNYAKKGYACRHNLGYWTGVPYIGFGLGAVSCSGGVRSRRTRRMEAYLSGDFAGRVEEVLSERDQMSEMMILGLRLTEGVSEKEFRARFGTDIEEAFPGAVQKHERFGLLEKENGHVRLTLKGADLANAVMQDFLP